MSLVVEIVAHKSRQEMATQLSETVQAEKIWLDNGHLGEWRNHVRAWKHAAESEATHACVLQDDAVPIEGFREHVEQAVSIKPNDPISLYVGTHRPHREEVLAATKLAEGRMASWLVAPTLYWGVGLVLPVEVIPEMLEVCKGSRLPYDQRIGWWAKKTQRPVYYTWPSLVDHADTETVAHSSMRQQGKRVAHKVGEPNWSDIVVPIHLWHVGSKRDLAPWNGKQT